MNFGRNSMVLAIAIANGALLAGLLWHAGRQRPFLRALAALVGLIALRLVPYMIGFAGAYDEHQWLTFAPFDLSLGFGPLVWMYLVHLSTGAWPTRWRWHCTPALAQLAYQLAAFALPLETKWNWYTTGHRNVVEPVGFALAVLSLLAYVAAGWRQFRVWQQWMDDHLSNREAFRLGVVRIVLAGTALVAVLAAAFAIRSWFIAPTDYFDRLPMVLALALLAYVLGLAGWRQSGMPFPTIVPLAASALEAEPAPRAQAKPAGRPRLDYVAMGEAWQQQAVMEHWYRDNGLTLALFSQRLQVSPRTVSRVLSDGLGCTFNAFVNRMRVEDVRAQLANPANTRGLLPLALEAGFASKASFNRAFREVTGTSPSAVRESAIGDGAEQARTDANQRPNSPH